MLRKLCHHCGSEVRVKRAEFSQRAWNALIHWGEVSSEHAGKEICHDCYLELREILIDRTHEIESQQAELEISKAARS
ncbi:MAG: hypothetical protein OYH77_00115 [Pseudomonadota bacterium]|nr:hypothetical protein [Pseudomonadota bacterium]